MRRRALVPTLLAALVAGSCNHENPTEVFVVIDAQEALRDIVSTVSITVRASDASVAMPDVDVLDQTLGSTTAPVAFPVHVALVPENGDATRRFAIEATARDPSGQARGIVRAISSYRSGRILELRLVFEASCLDDLSCGAAETCEAGACAAAEIDPATLPVYDGAPDRSWVEQHFLKTPPKRGTIGGVAMDGDLIAMGTPEADGGPTYNIGGVVTFTRSPSTGAITLDQTVAPPNPTYNEMCGEAVALSGDLLAVGCIHDTSAGSGVITSFTPSGSDPTGIVLLYRRDTNGIFQLEAGLKSPHPIPPDTSDRTFGDAIAVSGDVVVVGDPTDPAGFELGSQPGDPWDPANTVVGSGSVFIYRRVAGMWTFERHLKHHDIAGRPGYGGGFGYAVDVDGDSLVVGAPVDAYGDREVRNGAPFAVGGASDESGSVSTFAYVGGVWTRESFIQGSEVQSGDHFGTEVALDAGTLVVLAPYDRSTARGVNPPVAPFSTHPTSAAYVFARDPLGAWSELDWIKLPSEVSDDTEQMRVDLDGNYFVIGMRFEDASVRGVGAKSNATVSRDTDQGAAFVYRRSAGVFLFDAYLKASNADPYDNFGAAVAVSSSRILVVAPGEDGGGIGVDDFSDPSGGSDSGAAYFFVPNP